MIPNSFLQSKKWQKLQDDLGEKSHYKETADYTYLAIEKTTPFGKYLYLPYGPCYTSEKALKEAIKDLQALAKSVSAFFIRIEPRNAENAKFLRNKAKINGSFIKKSKDLNPAETWVIDLEGSDEDLKAKLPSRLLRYYRNREKNDITIRTSKNPDDINHLLRLQKALAKKKKIGTFSATYLKTQLKQDFATLYLVEHEKQVVAAGLVFDDETTRYNLQGAQDETVRNLHATGILTIQLILDAKEKGLKTFDCWGIAPEGAPKTHPWAGFTAFKKTFDGREVDYAGTWDIIEDRLKYNAYGIFRSINRTLRKIK